MLINAARICRPAHTGPGPWPGSFRIRRRLRIEHRHHRSHGCPQQGRACSQWRCDVRCGPLLGRYDRGTRDRDLRDQSETPRPAMAGIAGCRSGSAPLWCGLRGSRSQDNEGGERPLTGAHSSSHYRSHLRGRGDLDLTAVGRYWRSAWAARAPLSASVSPDLRTLTPLPRPRRTSRSMKRFRNVWPVSRSCWPFRPTR